MVGVWLWRRLAASFEVRNEDGSGLLGVRRGAIAITLDCPMTGHGRDACVSLEIDSADRY
jgi:hypothetical protein